MRTLLVSLTAVALAVAGSANAYAQDQAGAAAEATATATATAEQPATDAAPAANSADLQRASRYKTAGAVLTVFGTLFTAMGVGMVLAGDDPFSDDERGVPIEVGVAAVGVTALFSGLYFTATAKRIEANAKKTEVAPILMRRGVGVAVTGRF